MHGLIAFLVCTTSTVMSLICTLYMWGVRVWGAYALSVCAWAGLMADEVFSLGRVSLDLWRGCGGGFEGYS